MCGYFGVKGWWACWGYDELYKLVSRGGGGNKVGVGLGGDLGGRGC